LASLYSKTQSGRIFAKKVNKARRLLSKKRGRLPS